MHEHETARDFLLSQIHEICMLHDLPYVDISPLRCVEPPGIIYPLEDVIRMQQRIQKRLETLSPSPKGSYCVGISSDLRTIILARTPTRQLTMDLSGDDAGVHPKSLAKLTHDEMSNALCALENAQDIAKAQSRGEVCSAEDLSLLISKSPTPELVRKTLKLMGRDLMSVSIDNQIVTIGGGDTFPPKLPSKTVYLATLTIEDGVNEREQLTHIRVKNCEPHDSNSIAARSSRTDLQMKYLDPQDGKLLIGAQFSNCNVVAEVCVEIDSFSGTVASMTLRKITNREVILSTLKNNVEQGTFAF